MSKFSVDPAILAVSHPLAMLKLSEARIMDDARFPWVVLVPRRAAARELDHLSPNDRLTLMEEMVAAGAAVRAIGAGLGRPVEKLNVGALGNVTPQLHIHVVGRRADDPCWPGPVWGQGAAKTFTPQALAEAIESARPAFGALAQSA